MELKINETLYFEDSLAFSLTNFSHKRPYKGGATQATAYVSISKGDVYEEIELSIHGVQGKSPSEDGLTDYDRYDTIVWKGYEIELKKINYDESIKVIVSKDE